MPVKWLTAFIDRPTARFDDAIAFWLAVTASSLSSWRGDQDEFATLVPPAGDAHLRVQRLARGPGGCHLDVHVADIEAFAQTAVSAGAVELQSYDDVVVLSSPAGLPWCVVRHEGETTRQAPVALPDGNAHLVDQLCMDTPSASFEAECTFWERVAGHPVRTTAHKEFRRLDIPDTPLRLLLQQRDDDNGPARAHLDLASSNVDAVAAHNLTLGASLTSRFDGWTVLHDPAGLPYCLTARPPLTTRSGLEPHAT